MKRSLRLLFIACGLAATLFGQTTVQTFESITAGTTASGLPSPFFTSSTYGGMVFASGAQVVNSPALAGARSLEMPNLVPAASSSLTYGVSVGAATESLTLSALVRSGVSSAWNFTTDAFITFGNTNDPLNLRWNTSQIGFRQEGGASGSALQIFAGIGSFDATGVTWNTSTTYLVTLSVSYTANEQTLSISDYNGGSPNALWSSGPSSLSNTGTKDYALYLGNGGNTDAVSYFDNISSTAAAVPEPSTYAAVFGLAALGWVIAGRRRSRQS